ncbi:Gfo/Idh/MocA family oxidoreductase [Chloroflexi bacterium TSY]|nr:Gfo/Idh/MocA family oxidoreductase [Chloroflexi bacterium TSY]
MKTIRWEIIGCGDVCEVKSGPSFQKADNSALVAVMRRNGELAADYAQRHNVPKWYDDGQKLIDDPNVDAIYVATPPYAHHEYTLLAAQAGKPVYVEKPMAMSVAQCTEMKDACRDAGVPLWVGFYRRRLPRFLKMKELVDEGAIGAVRMASITLHQPANADDYQSDQLPWRVRPEIAGSGYFRDLASHALDFLDYLLGPIQAVQGYASNQAGLYAAEDMVSGSFVFESGVHGVGTWCFSTDAALDQIAIVGEKGKITCSTYDNDPVTLITADETTTFSIDHPMHVHQPLIQTIVDELNGSGQCPSTGESGARTTWVMEEMIEEYYKRANYK